MKVFLECTGPGHIWSPPGYTCVYCGVPVGDVWKVYPKPTGFEGDYEDKRDFREDEQTDDYGGFPRHFG